MLLGLTFSFIFGTIIGSFLNVVILRLPEGETLQGSSHCANCKHELGALDLVPLFSFIFLRGKCRYCGQPISKRYITIEIITALLFSICYLHVAPYDLLSGLTLVKYFLVSALMVVVFIIDLEHFLILDSVVLSGSILLFIINLSIDLASKASWSGSLTFNAFLAATGLYLFFGSIYYISKGRWMGFGDVKLSFILGQATVFPVIIANIFLSFMIGSVIGVVLLLFRVKNFSSEIPFGTFLALSTIVSLFYGQQLLSWYIKIIGLSVYV